MFFDEEIKKAELECSEKISKMARYEKSHALDGVRAALEEMKVSCFFSEEVLNTSWRRSMYSYERITSDKENKKTVLKIIDSVAAISQRSGGISDKYDDVRSLLMTGQVKGEEILPVDWLESLYYFLATEYLKRKGQDEHQKLEKNRMYEEALHCPYWEHFKLRNQVYSKFSKIKDELQGHRLAANEYGLADVNFYFMKLDSPVKKIFLAMNLNSYVLALLIANKYYKKYYAKWEEERKNKEWYASLPKVEEESSFSLGSLLGSLFGKYTDHVNQQMYGVDTSRMSNQDKFRVFHENRTKD